MNGPWEALERGRELVRLRRFEEASRVLSPALVEAETAATAFCLLSQCRLELGDFRGAEDAAGSALAEGATGEWPHRLRAVSLLRRRRVRDAIAAAEEAVRQEPEDDHALHILTVAKLVGRRKREALPIAVENVRVNPGSALAHRTLATAQVAVGQRDDAEFSYRNALRLDPQDKEAALELAGLLRARGRAEEAGQVYLAAAAVDPTDSRIRRGLSRLGLPVIGAGAVGIGKLATIVGVQAAAQSVVDVSFGLLTVLWLAGAVAVTSVSTVLRVRGGRSLPPAVRAGLKADYRNSVLRAGQVTGLGCLVLAVWGLASGSVVGGIAVGVVGLALLAAHRWWWSGPRPPRRLRLRRWTR